jgi:uncharacterized membrane protein
MVSKLEQPPGHWRFVLRPNRSATWLEIKLFFAAIAAVSLTVAIAFSLMGFWPVLPFAGAELAFLWVCLCHSAASSRDTEVIDIDDETVAVERGRNAPERRWQFPRAWARVRLEPSPARLHPSRLLIGSHGRNVRLGRFLTEDELAGLARELRSTLARS